MDTPPPTVQIHQRSFSGATMSTTSNVDSSASSIVGTAATTVVSQPVGLTHSFVPSVSGFSSALPAPVLGNLPIGPSRPFVLSGLDKIKVPGTASDAGVAAEKRNPSFGVVTFNPGSHANFKTVLQPWSYVQFTALTATISPCPAAAQYITELHWAWIPSGEDAPTSANDFFFLPTHREDQYYSPLPSGLPPQVSLDCPLNQWSLVSVVKPKPAIGGSPTLCIGVLCRPRDSSDPTPGENLLQVRFDLTVHIG